MSHSRFVSAALLISLVAVLAACHPAPATSSGGGRTPAPATLGVSARRAAARVTLEISWKGVPASALLLVNLDSPLAVRSRSRPIRSEGVELYGVTLVARVSGSGKTRLSLDAPRLASFLDDSLVVATVLAPEAVTAEVLVGDRTVMGGQHVERVEPVRAAEFSPKFRLVFSGDTNELVKIFAPGSLEGIPDRRKLIASSAEVASSARVLVRLR